MAGSPGGVARRPSSQKVKSIMMQTRYAGLVVLLALALAGCATMGPPKTPEELVAERAAERHALYTAGEFVAAYEFLTPGLKSGMHPEVYAARMRGRPVTWNEATIREVTCETERSCNVSVRVALTVRTGSAIVGTQNLNMVLNESWVLDSNGEWSYLQDGL